MAHWAMSHAEAQRHCPPSRMREGLGVGFFLFDSRLRGNGEIGAIALYSWGPVSLRRRANIPPNPTLSPKRGEGFARPPPLRASHSLPLPVTGRNWIHIVIARSQRRRGNPERKPTP